MSKKSEERKHWLLSRKFWLALLSLVVVAVEETVGIGIDPELLKAVVYPVIAYIAVEGAIDIVALVKAMKELAKDVEDKN